ncbi:unnamed protein product [Gordionus sp. m RMFG-2023]
MTKEEPPKLSGKWHDNYDYPYDYDSKYWNEDKFIWVATVQQHSKKFAIIIGIGCFAFAYRLIQKAGTSMGMQIPNYKQYKKMVKGYSKAGNKMAKKKIRSII